MSRIAQGSGYGRKANKKIEGEIFARQIQIGQPGDLGVQNRLHVPRGFLDDNILPNYPCTLDHTVEISEFLCDDLNQVFNGDC